MNPLENYPTAVKYWEIRSLCAEKTGKFSRECERAAERKLNPYHHIMNENACGRKIRN